MRKKDLPKKILALLVTISRLAPVRRVGRKFSFNKRHLVREEVVKSVSRAVVESYLGKNKVEAALAARTAKAFQSLHFRSQIKAFKEKIADEKLRDEVKRNYYLSRIDYYREKKRDLSACSSDREVLSYLSTYYAGDISADFEPAFFLIFKKIAYKVFPNFAKSIRASEASPGALEKLREVIWEAPVIFIPNHLSNADHLPVCMALSEHKLPQPRIAGGANLFKGVSAVALPRLNVYKIRREYIGEGGFLGAKKWFQNPIYRQVHSEYLRHGWDNNEPMMFYIEGTRSRDGKLGKPKLGILADAYDYVTEKRRPVYIVPVSLSYTIVPEDVEIEASRVGENISNKDLISQLTALDKAYKSYPASEMHVRFSPPIEIAPEEKSISEIGDEVMEVIGREIITEPTSALAACILKMKHQTMAGVTFHTNDMEELFQSLLDHRGDGDDKKSPAELMAASLGLFEIKGFVRAMGTKDGYEILNEPLIRQYANRIAHKITWL